MKDLSKYLRIFGLAALVSIFFFACKKDDSGEFSPDRMFSPAGEVKSQNGEVEVHLTWKDALYSKGATYTVDISKDTLFTGEPLFSLETDTTGIILTDDQLEVKQKYYARIRTNAQGNIAASNWIYSVGFLISGEQLFSPINQQLDLKDKSVLLKWRLDPTVDHIRIVKEGEASINVQLSAADVEAGEKKIEGLTPSTAYFATLFAGSKEKGTISFTTKIPSLFTVELTTEDDLAEFINNAANNDVIGLAAGTYDISGAETVIMTKHITLASVSGNPNDTKVLTKGFMLRGNGAGIVLQDLTLDAQNVDGTYLIDLRGETSDGENAVFSSITIKGSIIQNIGRAVVRGSRGSNRGHQIGFIRIENTIFHDNDTDYALFEIQKLALNKFEMVNSTINRLSNNIIRYDTNIGTPAAEILFDHVTVNAFGNNTKRPLLDVNTPANIVFANSIIANSAWASGRYSVSTTNTDLLRAGNGATAKIANTNLFNLTTGATPPVQLKIPADVIQVGNRTEALPWTYTTNELTIPANSPLLEASSTGGAIGDPRWVAK